MGLYALHGQLEDIGKANWKCFENAWHGKEGEVLGKMDSCMDGSDEVRKNVWEAFETELGRRFYNKK